MNKTKIKRLVRAICPDIKITFNPCTGNYFCSRYNKINIDLGCFRYSDGGFLYHIEKSHNYKYVNKISIIVWSILHEIGHYETEGLEYDEDYDEYIRDYCATIPISEAEKDPELAKIYFDLPKEWEATEWAIDFVESHPLLINELTKATSYEK